MHPMGTAAEAVSAAKEQRACMPRGPRSYSGISDRLPSSACTPHSSPASAPHRCTISFIGAGRGCEPRWTAAAPIVTMFATTANETRAHCMDECVGVERIEARSPGLAYPVPEFTKHRAHAVRQSIVLRQLRPHHRDDMRTVFRAAPTAAAGAWPRLTRRQPKA